LQACRPWPCHFVTWCCQLPCVNAVYSVTLLLAVLYNVPLFFEREVKYPHSACSAFPVSIGKTPLGDSFVYFFVYKTLCYFAFRSGGPLVTLIYINVRLYRALRMRRRLKTCSGPISLFPYLQVSFS